MNAKITFTFSLTIFLVAISTNANAGWLKKIFNECYPSSLQVRAKYERCRDLGEAFSPKLKQKVWTFVCSTKSGNDVYADFILNVDKDDVQWCRTHRLEY
jgi:hypothetical protein